MCANFKEEEIGLSTYNSNSGGGTMIGGRSGPLQLSSNPNCDSSGKIDAVCELDAGKWYCVYIDEPPNCTRNVILSRN